MFTGEWQGGRLEWGRRGGGGRGPESKNAIVGLKAKKHSFRGRAGEDNDWWDPENRPRFREGAPSRTGSLVKLLSERGGQVGQEGRPLKNGTMKGRNLAKLV